MLHCFTVCYLCFDVYVVVQPSWLPNPIRLIIIIITLDSVCGVLISLLQTIEPVGGYTTESVTRGQCDARPTVLLSHRVSPPFVRYQIILLGARGT